MMMGRFVQDYKYEWHFIPEDHVERFGELNRQIIETSPSDLDYYDLIDEFKEEFGNTKVVDPSEFVVECDF